MSSGGVLRVGIPASLRKTIQDLKEISSKHSDEDIYAMLKECNMDPNETAQKLLYLDTFHEVKRKHNKKKLIVSNHQAVERNRWAPGMQRRGARGGRGNNNNSGYSSNGGQRVGPPKENGTFIQTPVMHVHPNTKIDAAYETSSSIDRPTSSPHSCESNAVKSGEGTSADGVNSKAGTKDSLPNVTVKIQDLNPGPAPTRTPTPTPTSTPSTTTFSIVSGVYSSASDPVLLPSLTPRNPSAVGTIKRETGMQKIADNTSLPEARLSMNQDVGKVDLTASRTIESNIKAFTEVESDDPSSEPLTPTSMLSQDNGTSNVMTHMGSIDRPRADTSSIPKADDLVLGQATRKLEDLHITMSQKPVKFPDHVQVPEAFRNGFTFGTLDGSFGQEISASEDTKLVDSTGLSIDDGASEPSLSHEIASKTAHEREYPSHVQSFQSIPLNLSVMEVNALPTAPPLSESSKPEIMPVVGGSPYSFLPSGPDYGFSMMQPMLAPHLVHVDETKVNNSSVSSASDSSQPSQQTTAGVTAISPPLFPYIRHPYPSNYFPYNPYLPYIYMTPNGPQFFGHSAFAQQPSPGNMYMPPPQAAGTGVKFPIPQIYKPGTVPANVTHFGIPSGYGAYGLGYGIAAAPVTPGSSSSTEDLTAPELKEKEAYPVMKQNEEPQPQVWTSASARDLQNLQANFYYNFPHGQPITYAPAPPGQQGSLAGMYHLTTTPTTAAAAAAAAAPPPPSLPGSVETPAGGAYQQPHTPAGWNPKLLNRENI